MPSRRNFLRRSSSTLLGAPLLPNLFQHDDLKWRTASTQDPLSAIRSELLLNPDLIYLNTATLGPSPETIVNGVHDLTWQLEGNPAVLNWGELGREMEEVRDIIGDFIGADREEILLTRNTTEGLSLVTTHLGLRPGDEILTTNHEHGGGYLGPDYMEKYHGVVMKKIELPLPVQDTDQILQLIKQHLSEKTRLLLLSHVSTVDGLKMPLKAISELVSDRNIFFLVDGAQSAGQLPIDVENFGIDAFATSGHKWLLGPKETGFLYLKKDHHEKFTPIFTEGGFKTYSKSSGTRNVANIIGLGQTVKMHEVIEVDRIARHCLDLRQYAYGQLAEIRGSRLISPTQEDLSCGIVSIELEKVDKRRVVETLKQRNIVVKQLPDLNALRFSCHLFNTRKEIDHLCLDLEQILSG